jgi:excisionase family DNA binding protein
MVATCASETEARRRRLEELFEDQPFLSPTMKASRLHEREDPAEAVALQLPWQEINNPRERRAKRSVQAKAPDTTVRRVGFIVTFRDDPEGRRMDLKPDDAPDVMSASEAAQFLRVGASTLRKLIRDRGLPFTQIGRSRRFRRASLLRWMRMQEGRG